MSEPLAAPAPASVPALDTAKLEMLVDRLRGEQNFAAGLVAGLLGAAIGAGLWAVITVLIHAQIGWMAVGVGFLTGLGVRSFGHGLDKTFGAAGAVLALAGCVAGNILTVAILVAREGEIAFTEILGRLSPGVAWQLLAITFSPMDVLFYGLAVYFGYKYSFRRVSPDELVRLLEA